MFRSVLQSIWNFELEYGVGLNLKILLDWAKIGGVKGWEWRNGEIRRQKRIGSIMSGWRTPSQTMGFEGLVLLSNCDSFLAIHFHTHNLHHINRFSNPVQQNHNPNVHEKIIRTSCDIWVNERYMNQPRPHLNENNPKKDLQELKVTIYINKMHLTNQVLLWYIPHNVINLSKRLYLIVHTSTWIAMASSNGDVSSLHTFKDVEMQLDCEP